MSALTWEDRLVEACGSDEEEFEDDGESRSEELMSKTRLGRERKEWLAKGRFPLTGAYFDKPFRPANTGFIYAIGSPSGKWYIGQTRQELYERWKQHNHPARVEGGCRLIARAFQKYGANNMEMWILESNVHIDQLNERERALIERYGTHDPNGMGYNLTPGGEESPMMDPDVAARSSRTHKTQWQDPKHRAKMSTIRKNSIKCQQHYEHMRSSKPEIDYWSMPRAKALKHLKTNKRQHVKRAEQDGRQPDPSIYDVQIAEHERRHEEKYYDMPPPQAVRLLKAAKSVMRLHYRKQGLPFEREWWYDDQIKAHLARAEQRTSSRSLPETSTHRVENANGKARVSQPIQESDDSMRE